MVFYCQRNCFATSYKTVVVACKKSKVQLAASEAATDGKQKSNNKKQKAKEIECYEVLFEDTVLFPEGGGQPDDRGTVQLQSCTQCSNNTANSEEKSSSAPTSGLNNLRNGAHPEDLLTECASNKECCRSCTANVLRVTRRGGEAVHYLDKAFDVGSEVLQRVDWTRRKEHMQQHSAQHLITAIADSLYGFATISWNLGLHTSSIELNTNAVSADQLQELETRVNAVVAAAVAVTVQEYELDDPQLDQGIRSRGLPADHVGGVRVVSITGVDSNMCCGTHVANTAQLQAIKLLCVEGGKQTTLLTFLAGDRLLRYLSDCHSRQRSLHALLNTNPENFVSIVQKTQVSLKVAEKTSKEALRDLASAEAHLFMLSSNRGEQQRNIDKESTTDALTSDVQRCMLQNSETRLWCHHRRLADMDYLNALVSSCDDQGVLKILTAGEEKGPGLLVIDGPPDLVGVLAPQVCSVLEGKGGGRSRFTGKVTALYRREMAYKLVRDYLHNLHTAS
uniref:Alanyl-tRNA editing protein Aarsd1-like n=1 Tax=Hirondellea gigas TaxID=1518452 RepID=A0A2P2I714_9CRUS